MKIASSVFTNPSSVIFSSFFTLPSYLLNHLFPYFVFFSHLLLCTYIPHFHLHSPLLLFHPDSGSSDRQCLAYWSWLSSSPLPTVLKERTRRWVILTFFSLHIITLINCNKRLGNITEINIHCKREVEIGSACPNSIRWFLHYVMQVIVRHIYWHRDWNQECLWEDTCIILFSMFALVSVLA